MDKAEYDMQKELIELKHQYRMKEFEEERRNMSLFHEKECERIRIKSAEIRKSQMRKNEV